MEQLAKRIAELEAEVAVKDAIIAEQAATIARLTAEVEGLKRTVAELLERLNRNSSNSHLPPSSDGPGARSGGQSQGAGNSGKGNKPRGGNKRKRGAQPGHRGSQRVLLPPDEVDKIENLYPPECENCWSSLPEVEDPNPVRHQVTEVPPIKPHTTEYRRHAVTCACGHTTRASNAKVPQFAFGPRLMSLIALFTGIYHLSRRQTVRILDDVLGVRISLGAVSSAEERVSKAIEPAVAEAWSEANRAEVKHADATSWLEAGAKRTLWVIATTLVTVFKIVVDGSSAHIKPLLGDSGILVSDRATVFSFWRMKLRQVCWAHLARKFIGFSERAGPASEVGHELLGYAELLFAYWHDYRAGRLTRTQFCDWMTPVREQFENCLERAAAAGLDHVSGSCADILGHRDALWTFLARKGVPPTNNHAEQELRRFVLWRKRCFGAQSARGHLFAERIMTVAHTARKQGRNVLGFLTEACTAQVSDGCCPSLMVPVQAAS